MSEKSNPRNSILSASVICFLSLAGEKRGISCVNSSSKLETSSALQISGKNFGLS